MNIICKIKKYAYALEINQDKVDRCIELYRADAKKLADICREKKVAKCRIYEQKVEGKHYLFQYCEMKEDADCPGFIMPEDFYTNMVEKQCSEAAHVYEFIKHEGDDYSHLEYEGLIIGVRDGKLDEYIRLHDNQPQVIHDLCYQNGFRESSIFTVSLPGGGLYLLQFVGFMGEENPELYENETYQEWLRVTGECQQPLPGEDFWKSMKTVFEFKSL